MKFRDSGMSRTTTTAIRCVILAACLGAAATEKHRIDSAIEAVEHSGLTFIRSGREFDGPAAAEQLRSELELRQQVRTFDQFIEQVASRSAISGETYLVRLPSEKTMPLATWLREHDAAHWGK